MNNSQIINADWIDGLKTLESESVQCCVTSPPYWGLRDYGVSGQLGLEKTPEEYVEKIVAGFREVKRVLRNNGTLWLNLGDSYAHPNTGGNGATGGDDKSTLQSKMPPHNTTPVKKFMPKDLQPKNLIGIPWKVAFALQSDGWYLRQDIIWSKPNPMPESVTDRCTKSHEYIFLLSKSARYYYDNEAIKEETLTFDFSDRNRDLTRLNNTPGRTRMAGLKTNQYEMRNRRSVWSVNTQPYKEAHFATFPQEIPRTCILAGSKKGDTILDPFCGSGTTGEVALKLDRNFIGIELNQKYVTDLIIPRLDNVDPLFRGIENG